MNFGEQVTLFVIAFLLVGGLFGVQALEKPVHDWSVSASKDGRNIQISASACYENPQKAKISFYWNESRPGQQDKSVNYSCGCDDLLKINEVIIGHETVAELIGVDLPLSLESVSCEVQP